MPPRKPRVSPEKTVVSQAPCRADLAGSTLDIWPLYLFHPGAVTVNFAVNVLATCRVSSLKGKSIQLRSLDTSREERFADLDQLCRASKFKHALGARLIQFFQPQEGLLLETDSESPAGAGIAGSSALTIAAIGALVRFTGRKLSREEMRVLAMNVEAQLIHVPTGCQDHYPALYGGVSAIELSADGSHRHSLPIAPEEIEARFLLAYTGAPRQSGINNWEVFKAHMDGNKRVRSNFQQIAEIAVAMSDALANADWANVARLLREEWKLRRTNAPGITTPLIDELVAAAGRNGGRAAKVCGAGGGGCVVFLVEEDAKEKVAKVLRDHGAKMIPFRVAREGLTLTTIGHS